MAASFINLNIFWVIFQLIIPFKHTGLYITIRLSFLVTNKLVLEKKLIVKCQNKVKSKRDHK